MGFYWQNRMGGGHVWPFAGLFMFVLFIGLVVVLFALMRHYRPMTHHGPVSHARGSAIAILQERFARGEIDEDEYRRRLALLHEPPPT